jgi:hypothetical protein
MPATIAGISATFPLHLHPIPLFFFSFSSKRVLYINLIKKCDHNRKNGRGLGGVHISEKMCEMCKQKFHLQEHQSGLVFDDKFFICEDCRTNMPEQEIMGWSQSTMRSPTSAMPISLWLIQEQNKNKLPFSRRKE